MVLSNENNWRTWITYIRLRSKVIISEIEFEIEFDFNWMNNDNNSRRENFASKTEWLFDSLFIQISVLLLLLNSYYYSTNKHYCLKKYKT